MSEIRGNKMESVMSFLVSVKQVLLEFWKCDFASKILRDRNTPELYEPD